MLNAMPFVVTVICFVLALLTISGTSLLLVCAVRREPSPGYGVRIAREAVGICFFLLWGMFLGLALGDLTFDPLSTMILRYLTLVYPLLCLLLALTEHEGLPMIPGFFAVLTVPFFETAFGSIFPYVLLAMLLGLLIETLLRLIREIRTAVWSVQMDSIQETIDTLDDGLLFAEESGRVLLCNRTMEALSTSLCRQELADAKQFWAALEEMSSSDFITKVSQENSFLFRFTGGNTWTLHRENRVIRDRNYLQIVALNITDSDHIQSQIMTRRSELSRTAEQLQQVKETIGKLQEEEAKVTRGHEIFDSITGKMASLNRFFTDHYALPAETFDYRRLAGLTSGLIQDLEHAPEMTAAHQLELTVATFELLGIPVTITGEMPEDRQIAAAFVGMIREAAVNAVIHGNASAVDVVLEEDEEQFRCRVSNNGLPLNGILTPGNGITGIRRSLFPMNGQLEIVKEPAFVLTVKIPKRKM